MQKNCSALLISVATFAITSPVAAQSVSDDTASPAEIIVTAQKRQQSVQDVAAAITAISADTIEQRGVTSASNLQFIVPSTQIGNLLGQTAVTIRGVGLNEGAPGYAAPRERSMAAMPTAAWSTSSPEPRPASSKVTRWPAMATTMKLACRA